MLVFDYVIFYVFVVNFYQYAVIFSRKIVRKNFYEDLSLCSLLRAREFK